MDHPKTIVIMDENAAVAESVRVHLSERGYRAFVVGDGPRGLAAVEAVEPDLVIVELLLPGKSGFRVLDAVKARPTPVPVIMLASLGGPAQRAYAEFLGADAY